MLAQINVGELMAHEVALFYADAMFSGEAATHFNAELQDVVSGLFGLVSLFGVVAIIEDQRM